MKVKTRTRIWVNLPLKLTLVLTSFTKNGSFRLSIYWKGIYLRGLIYLGYFCLMLANKDKEIWISYKKDSAKMQIKALENPSLIKIMWTTTLSELFRSRCSQLIEWILTMRTSDLVVLGWSLANVWSLQL